jgi:hypothetical protein
VYSLSSVFHSFQFQQVAEFLTGCINKLVQPLQSETQWWLIGGLGSRGLIYHGWLGERVAAAMTAGDASLIPSELNQFGAVLAQV